MRRALVRLCCGGSVSTAYGEDKRDVRVGGKLKGLHHAKTVLVRYFHDFRKSSRSSTLPSTQCLIGSCNFTTSSKANAEAGVFLRLSRGSTFEKDWIHAFEACYQSGESIEEFETRVASSKSIALRSGVRQQWRGSEELACGSSDRGCATSHLYALSRSLLVHSEGLVHRA